MDKAKGNMDFKEWICGCLRIYCDGGMEYMGKEDGGMWVWRNKDIVKSKKLMIGGRFRVLIISFSLRYTFKMWWRDTEWV